MQHQKVTNNETHMGLDIEDTNHPCYWIKASENDSGKAWVNFTQYRPGVGGNNNLTMVARQYSSTRGSRKVVRINFDERSALALFRFLEAKFGSTQ